MLSGSTVLTLCDPTDYSPPGFSVHGIFQVRILEWLPFPTPGALSDLGIEPGSPALQADSLPSEPPGKPSLFVYVVIMLLIYWYAQYNLIDPQNHSSFNWKFVFFD